MIRLVTRGRFTHDYAKGLVAALEDREPAVRKLIEGAGGKLVSFYFTTGASDFMLISEADEAASILAALLAAAASGTISDVTTARAWTGAEFKAVAEKASKAASVYRAPARAEGEGPQGARARARFRERPWWVGGRRACTGTRRPHSCGRIGKSSTA
jgi:uncharacterized protein with GYD domain